MHLYSILVVDDEAIIREGIKYLFDYEALGFSICGEAEDGTTALARIRALAPDVVLMDIRMPGLSGLDGDDFFLCAFPLFAENIQYLSANHTK